MQFYGHETLTAVKLNSKYFDMIRIAPRKAKNAEPEVHQCQHPGCTAPGPHRAPKGRLPDEKPPVEDFYYWFCTDHIREYNRAFNYFEGMSEAEQTIYREQMATGYRPTWKMGVNSWSGQTAKGDATFFDDPLGLFKYRNTGPGEQAGEESPRRRPPRNAERKALEALGLDETAALNDIKARYKELVKRFHPDANGGNRAAEDQLRKVIQAYDYLKKSGFC